MPNAYVNILTNLRPPYPPPKWPIFCRVGR